MLATTDAAKTTLPEWMKEEVRTGVSVLKKTSEY